LLRRSHPELVRFVSLYPLVSPSPRIGGWFTLYRRSDGSHWWSWHFNFNSKTVKVGGVDEPIELVAQATVSRIEEVLRLPYTYPPNHAARRMQTEIADQLVGWPWDLEAPPLEDPQADNAIDELDNQERDDDEGDRADKAE
jgi:hypothetical protein